jgi:ABC-type uncharacterized transport system permease subunit
MGQISVICFFSSYGLAFLGEAMYTVKQWKWTRLPALAWTIIGLVLHTIYLLNRHEVSQLPPLLASTHDWWLVLAWLAVVIYLVAALRNPNQGLGIFLLPCAMLIIALSFGLNHKTSQQLQSGQQFLTMLHASSLVLGFAGLFTAIVTSIMYLIQHLKLKKQMKWTVLNRLELPSLEKLVTWNHWSITTVAITLTIGLATGVILAIERHNQGKAISLVDPFIISYLLMWAALLAVYLWTITRKNRSGRHIAFLTLWACVFVLVIAYGLNLTSSFTTWHN